MGYTRLLMIKSLKKLFIPELRKKGFTGTFPHFRRITAGRTSLLTIQFDRNGGGFVIELANSDEPKFQTYWGKDIPLTKLTAHDLDNRKRIYPNSEEEQRGNEDWFRYDQKPLISFGNRYDKLAEKVTEKIPVMESYWNI